MKQTLRRINLQFNSIIKILIVSDFIVWSAGNMLPIVFPIFVIEKVQNADLQAAGFSSLIYLITSAIFTVPVGVVLDKIKGHVDEVYVLFATTTLRGILLFSFSLIKTKTALFGIQFMLGICRAGIYPSWRVLFSKYADSDKEGLQWSFYDSVLTVGMGLSSYLGSFIVEESGFVFLFQLVGALTVLGGLMTMLLKVFIKRKEEL